MAYIITLSFTYNINTSLQVGDKVYKTSTSALGGFSQNSTSPPIHIGNVHGFISPVIIEVYSEYVDSVGNPIPANIPMQSDYISFSKNRVVNNNDVLGYYTSVQFVNDSKAKAELFAVGSGVTESSK